MIKATIKRTPSGTIQSFKMTGHANFAEHGQDIICAGASAVAVGTVNAIETLCSIPAEKHTVMKSGFLEFRLPELEKEVFLKAQVLLEGMVISLRSIETAYGDFIKVND
ncbi:ribosomal-processing cysteine protease Prp [Bacillus sp. 165]|uniref:ribosomal-processing cysteine protease Prp n=1 Tax=Bacillus sp. 165 TaxID=1529117 RepID=UPI001AD9D08E|nr:ribosomal-processing cysteine protease Prp [Bacillus sp. 165]MBO9130498.1 ribosomal-processing cysteine protease Prp [Bacillus sp. 165]